MSTFLPFWVSAARFALAAVVITVQANSTALAQAPPVNDDCAGALIIPAAGPFPYLTPITLDITDASTDGDPDFPSCGPDLSRSVWYRFTPEASAAYAFSVCDDSATTVIDTVMAIFHSANGCAGPFTEVDCNDDVCGLRSGTVTTLSSNQTYYILVWLYGIEPPFSGETAVQLRVAKPVVPANDLCSGAVVIPASGPFPHLTVITDLTLATISGDPPTPSCQTNISRSIWYRFTPSTTAIYRISTCAQETGTTVRDSVMGVYTSPSCSGAFVEIACNDEGCGTQAALSASLLAGTNYWILVWAYDVGRPPIGGTDIQLRTARISSPTISSTRSSNVTATAAMLVASINPREGYAAAAFEWGISTNYGNSSTLEYAGFGAGSFDVSVVVTGLSPGTTYHFRAVATNEVGLVFGPNHTFTTAGPPNLTSSRILPDGAFGFQFTGFEGTVYTVLSSTNLMDWVELGPATDLGGGLFAYQDGAATNTVSRFYQVTVP